MTPLQLAKQECPNYHNGECDGINIQDNLSMSAWKSTKCVLRRNEKCKYFEECVLPYRGWVKDPRRAKQYNAAYVQYLAHE